MNVEIKEKKEKQNPPKKKLPNKVYKKAEKTLKKVVRDVEQKSKSRPKFEQKEARTERRVAKAAIGAQIIQARGTRTFERISRALALPGDSTPQRWNSKFASQPTAIGAPWAIYSAPWSGSITGGVPIPNTDLFVAIHKNALRAIIMYDPNTAGTQWAYQGYGSENTSVTNPALPATSWNVTTKTNAENVYLHVPYWQATSTYAPHDSILFAGKTKEKDLRFVWMDKGASFSLTILPSITDSSGGLVSLDIWTQEGFAQDAQSIPVTLSAGTPVTATQGIANSGYYAVRFQALGSAQQLTFSALTLTSVGSNFGHRPLPGFVANYGATESIRVNAAAVMYTNRASDLNKQGQIVGWQTPRGSHWLEYCYSGFSALSEKPGCCVKPISNGMYGFYKPTDVSEFEMSSDLVVSDAGDILDSFYRIDDPAPCVILYPQVTGTTAGQDGYFSFFFGVEYETQDTWRVRDIAHGSSKDCDEALEAIRLYVQFHENPLHWSEIWDGIKRVGKGIVKGINDYGPTIMNVAKMLGKLA